MFRRANYVSVEDEAAGRKALTDAVEALGRTYGLIVIDTPGHDNYLMRLAHSLADTLITPLNDSFVDFDVLGTVDPETFGSPGPAIIPEWFRRRAASANSITRRPTGSCCETGFRCLVRATNVLSATD